MKEPIQNSEERLQVFQILYELVMSIGSSMELERMLKTCLSTFIRKLNCSAAVLFRYNTRAIGLTSGLEPIISIPKTSQNNVVFQQAQHHLESILLEHVRSGTKTSFPVIGSQDNINSYYLLELPKYGILVLTKYTSPLSLYLVKSLKPLLIKLSNACLACENDAELRQEMQEKSDAVRLSRRELIKAKEKAEEASQAKSDFLSIMSHEIRTPLNAIIGMTSLLEYTNIDENQQNYLKTIKIGGENLLFVVNEVLDYSKIESGNLVLEQRNFSTHEPLDNAYNLLLPKAEQKGIDLNINIGPNIPQQVVGDSSRIQQILINLIGNAIKFTREGHVKVEVKKIEDQKDCILLQYTVEDTGIGIPASKLNRLFKPFSQVDASTTRKYGGTGLGLVICKKLAELMRGKIWVKSTEESGSSFFVNLQVRKLYNSPDPEVEPRKVSTKNPENTRPEGLPELRILVAEDNPINQKVILRLLQKLGYQAEIAENGTKAVEAFQKEAYDLIFMDMQMPEMDGLEATRTIRQLQSSLPHPRPTIVALTANAMLSDKEMCMEAGMDDFLSKPVKIDTIRHKIHELWPTSENKDRH